MLERSSGGETGGLFQFADQLPAIECVEKIDIARFAAEYLHRKVASVFHEDPGRFLIGVATVF